MLYSSGQVTSQQNIKNLIILLNIIKTTKVSMKLNKKFKLELILKLIPELNKIELQRMEALVLVFVNFVKIL